MKSKLYIYSNLEDLFFDLSRPENEKLEFIDCDHINFDDFIRLNTSNLFNQVNINIFYNAEKLDKESLILFLDKNTPILAFCKLDKRSKLFKLLNNKYKVVSIDQLTSIPIKKDFIKTILVEFNLSINYLDYFLSVLPDNRSIIYKEIEKFSFLYRLTGDLELSKKAVIAYIGNSDIFELISCFLEKNTSKFYFYLTKISEDLIRQQVYCLFSKKLMYLLMLSYDNKVEARKYIYTNEYYIKSDIKLAKRLGSKLIINLHTYLQDTLGDLYNDKSIYQTLSQFYVHYIEKSIL